MCGGAIISEFIPQRDAARGHGKRGLCAEDFWPPAATAAADLDDFAAASFHPDQGTLARSLIAVNKRRRPPATSS